MNGTGGEPNRLIPVTLPPGQLDPRSCGVERKESRMKARSVHALLLACAATSSVVAQGQGASRQIAAPISIATPIVYRNSQYGFCFLLPADWAGYTIVAETWSGTVLDSQKTEHGPQLLIRNPKWTEGDHWQDIPIMIFTPSQWKIIEADNMAVSAAPIGPSELGKNEDYVFALPPRWIGFYDVKGMDEVQTLINQNPFEAPCARSDAPPAK
jgi:hypothetical protein